MPIRPSTCVLCSLLLGLALIVSVGCAGGVEVTGLDAMPVQQDPPQNWPPPDNNPPANNFPPPAADAGSTPVSADAKPPATQADGSPPPPAADSGTPPAQQNPNAGKACPCTGGTYCVSGVCRASCTAPKDKCKVVSNCQSNESCVGTSKLGVWVCLPALQPGASCGMLKPCPVNHVCSSINLAAYKCLPVCSVANAPCGTSGGKCAKFADGCQVCSKP